MMSKDFGTINVTKPFLPPMEEYTHYLSGIWERNWLTNYGPLVTQLESSLQQHLHLSHVQFLVNGTVPLQIALKVLGITGEVITTPFSYVATTGAILWENCKPVFADIEPATFCIDATKIEDLITSETQAILATHVFGFPCDVEAIERIAKKHDLYVIYDAAHAFGVEVKGRSIMSYGDISTCSFHATKLFHTVEGGAIICHDAELNHRIFLHKAFGHIADDYFSIGINGKNSEFHAAMGLCNLPRVELFIARRREIAGMYRELLAGTSLSFPTVPAGIRYNYAYFPVLFRNEAELTETKAFLAANKVNTRRYFFPSLNNLPYLDTKYPCPVSEDIASRILCLPFYQQLTDEEVEHICKLLKQKV
jgi:dTDP-4-amino-4,6-dideoxygalactose transaminase